MKKLKTYIISLLGALCAIILCVNAQAANTYSATAAASASARLSNANTVAYTANLMGVPASDDGMIYLYALQPFEYAASATDVLVGTAPVSATPVFSFGLNNAAGVSMICNKFALAVKSGGALVTIPNSLQYITNPEVAATRTRPVQNVGFVEPYEKMGLYRIGEVDVATINAMNYSTCVIVNKADPVLINPWAKKGDSSPVKKMYYAFNAADINGVARLQSVMGTLAANTRVDEFIIGNEVNTRTWNYTAYMNWEQYVREYVQAFRVSYNAIKSTNANATVYISLDQMWDRNRTSDHSFYDGADFLIYFNQMICAEGNIDWGLAMHPYPTPLTYAKFWDMSGCANGAYYTKEVTNNKIVTFQNLPVMTSFMSLPAMLSPKGGVRNIILPELGITSAQGYEVQAASMMACYMACRNNPCIKRIYFHRMNEGGALNFGTVGISEQVYQSLVRGNPGEYNQWALNYIGISDWRQVVMY